MYTAVNTGCEIKLPALFPDHEKVLSDKQENQPDKEHRHKVGRSVQADSLQDDADDAALFPGTYNGHSQRDNQGNAQAFQQGADDHQDNNADYSVFLLFTQELQEDFYDFWH